MILCAHNEMVRANFSGKRAPRKGCPLGLWGWSGPISRVLSCAAIYLEAVSPRPSSRLPERTAGHCIALLFALAPDGVCQATVLPPCWCALTTPFQLFSQRGEPRQRESSFLRHFPSGRPAQPLAGILPCGARTFLTALRRRGHMAHSECYCSRAAKSAGGGAVKESASRVTGWTRARRALCRAVRPMSAQGVP